MKERDYDAFLSPNLSRQLPLGGRLTPMFLEVRPQRIDGSVQR